MDLEKAKLSDAILLKFKGNKTISWDEVKEEAFNDIHSDYYVIENRIKFLLGENILKEQTTLGVKVYIMLSMTNKGWGVMTDIESEGYVAQVKIEIGSEKKRIRNYRIGIATLIVAALALILGCLQHYQSRLTNQDNQDNQTDLKDTTSSKPDVVPLLPTTHTHKPNSELVDIDTTKIEMIEPTTVKSGTDSIIP